MIKGIYLGNSHKLQSQFKMQCTCHLLFLLSCSAIMKQVAISSNLILFLAHLSCKLTFLTHVVHLFVSKVSLFFLSENMSFGGVYWPLTCVNYWLLGHLTNLLLLIFFHRALYLNNFKFLNFFSKNLKGQLLPFLVWSIYMIRGILIMKFTVLLPPKARGWSVAKLPKIDLFSKISFCIPTWMVKFMAPGSEVKILGSGQYGRILKCDLGKSSSLLPYKFEKN